MIISESLTYERIIWIWNSSVASSVSTCAITKDGIYTANRIIGTYTVHESTLSSACLSYLVPEEMAGKEIVLNICLYELQKFSTVRLKISAQFYECATPSTTPPFYLENSLQIM